MDEAQHNTDQIAFWNDAPGRTWADCQDALDTQLEPMGERVIAALALRSGERVLDIGCGCGQTTLALGDAVGLEGRAVGVDISQPMLAVARGRAAGRPQVEFLEADAQTFAFASAGFDAIHSRFGVMFFDDPAAAFANLRRALRPGGRLAFLSWRTPAENPVMALPMQAALAHFPPQPPAPPDAPGPFAFADPRRVRAILADAGFSEVRIEPQDMPAGGNSLEVTTDLAFRIGPLGRLLREYPDARGRVVDDVRAALAPYAGADGRVFLGSATWIVTARNP